MESLWTILSHCPFGVFGWGDATFVNRRAKLTALGHMFQCIFVDSKERAGDIARGDDGKDASGTRQRPFKQGYHDLKKSECALG